MGMESFPLPLGMFMDGRVEPRGGVSLSLKGNRLQPVCQSRWVRCQEFRLPY